MASYFVMSTAFVLASLFTFWAFRRIHYRSQTTALNGPPSPNRLFGFGIELFRVKDPAALFEKWEQEYGSVFQTPTFFGAKEVVICDPKAIAHFYSKDTYTYQQPISTRFYIGHFVSSGILALKLYYSDQSRMQFGPGVLWAEADDHKRQRKALAPAFSNNSIRSLITSFYEAAYLLKSTWDSVLAAEDGKLIDVQHWMNAFTLDTIGTAGFSYDFGALKGRTSAVSEAFGSFGNAKPDILTMVMFIIGPVFPWTFKLPARRNILLENLKKHVRVIADVLLQENRAERKADATGNNKTNSVIQTLLRAETTDGRLRLSPDEVVAQNILLLAGYETTAVSLTWALIELSRHQDLQDKLREELSEFTQTDPTWDQLTSGLPFLDAVVCEVLRVHPALTETIREVNEDDIVPLSKPIRGPDGAMIDQVFLAKGTSVRIPIQAMQRSQAFWGEDGAEFKPSRWLDGSTCSVRASDVQGHRHLLTFIDGPRACLGRMFALTEFKAALTVLIRNYTFALPNGPSTKIGSHRAVLIRPKVEGELGANVPLIVKRVE